VYQRLGDQRSVLVTYLNLVSLYGEAGDMGKAQGYAERVFDAARRGAVEPSILLSTHGNLASGYSLAQRYDLAIEHLRRALELARTAQLPLHAHRARYNLANAFYRRFLATGDAAFERDGDAEVAALLAAPASETTASLTEAARGLKAEVLGRQPERSIDEMLDDEAAEHLAELAEIRRRRAQLAGMASPADGIRARLAIAGAYLAIAGRERQAAFESARQQGLLAEFGDAFEAWQSAQQRQLQPHEALAAAWKPHTADLLSDPQRAALAAALLAEGAVNKSACARLCQVSPATASKQLAQLAQRGLLAQTGRGPSTRYVLPCTD
jgi:hypothetical protein